MFFCLFKYVFLTNRGEVNVESLFVKIDPMSPLSRLKFWCPLAIDSPTHKSKIFAEQLILNPLGERIRKRIFSYF